jgi:hypothetical protein
MSYCEKENIKTLPLSRVVAAAIADSYEDIGKTQQLYSHWAARGLRKLEAESLTVGRQEALIRVNQNTGTGTLPADFDEEIEVYVISNRGTKIPLPLRTGIVNVTLLPKEEEVEVCSRCNQDTKICEEIKITEEENLVVINNATYSEKIIKKLYPNGDYFLEKSTPFFDETTGLVDYVPSSEFITNYDLKDCGCLETTDDNMTKLCEHSPEVYYCYYAGCDNSCSSDYGGYKIFEESGLIVFDRPQNLEFVYIIYRGYMPKRNGQYQVPLVAFEALVEWVKFKSVQNKRSISVREKDYQFQNFVRERNNMDRILGRISLSMIISKIGIVPKFDLDAPQSWSTCFGENNKILSNTEAPVATSCDVAPPTETINSVVRVESKQIAYEKIKFQVGVDPTLKEGESVLVIEDSNILPNSVNVVLNTQTLNENEDDEISYVPAYGASGVVIAFNQPAENLQKYTITYTKFV